MGLGKNRCSAAALLAVALALTAAIAGAAQAPAAGAPGPKLAAALQRELQVHYRKEVLSMVLWDLRERAGLVAIGPYFAGQETCLLTLDAHPMPAGRVLEALAAANGLQLDMRESAVLIWKPAPDDTLAALRERAARGDLKARCEALWELSRYADPRIYPSFFTALADREPTVAQAALDGLTAGHGAVLRYAEGREDAARAVAAQLAGLFGRVARLRFISLLGSLGGDAAATALIPFTQTGPPEFRQRAVHALGDTGSLCGLDRLRTLLKEDRRLGPAAAAALRGLTQPEVTGVLLDVLREARGETRASIAIALRGREDPRLVEALRPLLDDPSLSTRWPAIEALGAQDNPRAIELLIGQLADEKTAGSAARALGELRAAAAVNALLERAVALDPQKRFAVEACWTALGRIGDPRALEPLCAHLGKDGSEYAARALVKFEHPEARGEILKLLRAPGRAATLVAQQFRYNSPWTDGDIVAAIAKLTESSEFPTRRAAMEALAQLRDPKGIAAIAARLGQGDAIERSIAAHALGALSDPAAEAAILKRLEVEQEKRVREALVSALSSGRGGPAPERVLELLDHADPTVRNPAASSLAGRCRDARVRAALIGKLAAWPANEPGADAYLQGLGNHPSTEAAEAIFPFVLRETAVRQAALGALARMPGPYALHVLLQRARDADPKTRAAALAALTTPRLDGRLLGADPRTSAAVRPLARDPDADVRRMVAILCGHAGDPEALATSGELLRDAKREVREAAITALVMRGDPRADDMLLPLLADGDAEVRHRAADACIALGTRKVADRLLALLGDAATPKALRERIVAGLGFGVVYFALEDQARLEAAIKRDPAKPIVPPQPPKPPDGF